jgi:hypothetical protein
LLPRVTPSSLSTVLNQSISSLSCSSLLLDTRITGQTM